MTEPTSDKTIAIAYETEADHAQAQQLAEQLQLPLKKSDSCDHAYLLIPTVTKLLCRPTDAREGGDVFVDFVAGSARHRRLYGGGRQQDLAKACGLKSKQTATLIDATAGLGRDAFVLACLGCQVTMIEQSPIVAALLADGLKRLQQDPELSNDIALSLIEADAVDYLKTLASNSVDVIYLDPMFEARQKSALVKKEMRILAALLQAEQNNAALFVAATRVAKKRVVVKRARRAPGLIPQKPDLQYMGKSSRYDVYLQK